MTLRVVLTRHGESVWHHDNRYAGVTDIELTNRGRRQGEQLGRWARDAGLSAVWCSPLRRAIDTARPSALATGLDLRIDQRLREVGFGIAEGLTRAEMAHRFPEHLEAFHRDPVGDHFPEGEHPGSAAERYLEVLRRLQEEHDDQRVLVVGHSTALRVTLCRLLGLPVESYRDRFPFLANCALTEIQVDGDRVALLGFNQVLAEGDLATSLANSTTGERP